MKIVIAPDSFKGSLSATQAAQCIANGFRAVFPQADYVLLPVADGGEGMVDAFAFAVPQMQRYTKTVSGPLHQPVCAAYGILPDNTAVMEIAAATGITLVPQGAKNPMIATSFGTGELLLDALDRGCTKIILGLGGSATNDGGLGIFRALGGKAYAGCCEIHAPQQLQHITAIDCSGIDPRIMQVPIILATDVTNTLCGPQGATAVFGPQKGVAPHKMPQLDRGLACFARQFDENLLSVAGLGAAGGAGLPLYALGQVEIRSGIDVVLDCIGMDVHCADATLVITGEGKMDGQSIYGKVPVGVAKRAKQFGIPTVAIVGGMGEGAELTYAVGIDAIVPIPHSPMSLEQAIAHAPEYLTQAAHRLALTLKVGMSL